MPATDTQPPAVDHPTYPPHQLATFELAGYAVSLKAPSRSSTGRTLCPPVRANLQARLNAVLAEQESRKRLGERRP